MGGAGKADMSQRLASVDLKSNGVTSETNQGMSLGLKFVQLMNVIIVDVNLLLEYHLGNIRCKGNKKVSKGKIGE